MELMHKIRNARSLIYKAPDTALLLYQRVYSEARQAGFTYGMHLSLIGMGVIYTDKGDYKRSRSIYERVLDAPSYPKKKRLLPSLYVNLAKIAIYEGDFPLGYTFLDSALHYTRRDAQVLDTLTLATIHNNAGSILRTIGETQKALRYLNLAQKGAVALKDTGLLSAVYNNFISCYKNLKNYREAIAYSNRSIDLGRQSGDLKSQAYAFSARGTIHRDLKQYDEALLYFEKADSLLKYHVINDYRLQLFVYLTLGELYLATKHMDKAQSYLEAGKISAFKQKDLVMQYKALIGLSRYQAGRYNYPAAYKELLQAHELYDTILNKDNHKNINELETKYRTLEKDRKLVVQSLQLLIV